MTDKNQERIEIEKAMKDFFKKGKKITVLPTFKGQRPVGVRYKGTSKGQKPTLTRMSPQRKTA